MLYTGVGVTTAPLFGCHHRPPLKSSCHHRPLPVFTTAPLSKSSQISASPPPPGGGGGGGGTTASYSTGPGRVPTPLHDPGPRPGFAHQFTPLRRRWGWVERQGLPLYSIFGLENTKDVPNQTPDGFIPNT